MNRAENRRGRPTRLKPDVADRLVLAVANGASLTRAAADAGIGLRTLRDWIERGRAERYGQLVARIDAARATRQHQQRPWQDLIAQLEIEYPERWALDEALRELADDFDADLELD